MLPFAKGFIILCNGDTEEECIRQNMFGDKAQKMQDLDEIQPGDIGFLLNFDKDELLGKFKAASPARFNIEPKAWKGRFAAQVQVELLGPLQRIKDATFILTQAGVGMAPMATDVPAPAFPIRVRSSKRFWLIFRSYYAYCNHWRYGTCWDLPGTTISRSGL